MTRPLSPTSAVAGTVSQARFYRPVDSDLYQLTGFGTSWTGMAGDVLITARYGGRVETWSGSSSSPSEGVDLDLRWRADPGGVVLGLATVGSVTIAGDATDHVTAWSEDGWQLWRVPTTDVITAVLPLSEAVLVADASGKVVVRDAVTGAQRWSRQLNDVVSVAAVGGHVAVVAGTTLTVLDASTGAPKWRRTLARLTGSPLVVISAEVVVTKIDSWLVARDADSGKLVWWRRVDRAAVALRATVDQIVVLGAASTQAIAPDGGLRWSTTPALTVQQSGTLTALTYSDRVELWGGQDGWASGVTFRDTATPPTTW